jgi:hypothetical protein
MGPRCGGAYVSSSKAVHVAPHSLASLDEIASSEEMPRISEVGFYIELTLKFKFISYAVI